MLFELEISKYAPPGNGFGVFNGKAVFVPKAAKGDVLQVFAVKEKKSYVIAKIHKILSPSKDRATPECPCFDECGGCDLSHLDYQKQLDLKAEMLRETLSSYGYDLAPEIVPSPYSKGFRHRARLSCQNGRIGFMERLGKRLIPVSSCLALSKGLNRILEKFKGNFARNREYLPLESSAFGTVAAVFKENKQIFPLPGFPETIEENYGAGVIELRASGFAQSNPFVTKILVEKVTEACRDSRLVCELYCGAGTFSVPLSKSANFLWGYELNSDDVDLARKNMSKNNLSNSKFIVGNLEKTPINPAVDTIVADPPRVGLGKKIKKRIIKSKAEKFVYASCNPATLIRDLKELENGGFRIEELKGYDMHCQTAHLEALAILTR